LVKTENGIIGYKTIYNISENEIVNVWNGVEWYPTTIKKYKNTDYVEYIFSDGGSLRMAKNELYTLNIDDTHHPPHQINTANFVINEDVYNRGYHISKKTPSLSSINCKINWLSGIIDRLGHIIKDCIVIDENYPFLYYIKYILSSIGIKSNILKPSKVYQTNIDKYFNEDYTFQFQLYISPYYVSKMLEMGYYSRYKLLNNRYNYSLYKAGDNERTILSTRIIQKENDCYYLENFKNAVVVNDLLITKIK